MKKIGFVFCLLAIIFTSCDPRYDVDYRLANNSGHAVTFSSNLKLQDGFWGDHPGGVVIEPGQDSLYFVVREELGSANLASATDVLFRYEVYGDTIWFNFDDGKRLVYTREEGKGPYDFEGDHYTYDTKRGRIFLMPYDCYGCLTYTITKEDYANSIVP